MGNGNCTCVSIYGGPHVDFGDGQVLLIHYYTYILTQHMVTNGTSSHDLLMYYDSPSPYNWDLSQPISLSFRHGKGKGSILWIENIGHAEGVLTLFKEWFENSTHRKIWYIPSFVLLICFPSLLAITTPYPLLVHSPIQYVN